MIADHSSDDPRRAVRDGILAAVPNLRAFAMSLSGSLDRADDLVQETLLRALANIDSFEPGTNLPAWLFTILRNQFRTERSHCATRRPSKMRLMVIIDGARGALSTV